MPYGKCRTAVSSGQGSVYKQICFGLPRWKAAEMQSSKDEDMLRADFKSMKKNRDPKMSLPLLAGDPFSTPVFSPWVWIALIFFTQAAGAVVLALYLNMDFKQVAVPFVILLLGGGISLLFVAYDSSAGISSWKRGIPALLYAFFIFSLSNRSYPGVSAPFNTNLFHPFQYFTLGLLLGWIWYPILQNKGFFPFSLRVLPAGIFYGIADEIHQSFIPGRDPSWGDVLLDALGLSAACLVFVALRRFRKRIARGS